MRKATLLILLLLATAADITAQNLIQYESGMGMRMPGRADVWILYDNVTAEHDGMTLYADSAIYDGERNDFNAYRNVRVMLSDTTTIYGDHLYYDGERRVLDIWDDTVVMIDGSTELRTAHLSYDRNTSSAEYTTWGKTVRGKQSLRSREGIYNCSEKVLRVYRKVVLIDTSLLINTDTMIFHADSNLAWFHGPTHIHIDSTYIYSELGCYAADSDYAMSVKATHVDTDKKTLVCDTLYYWKSTGRAEAYSNVVITDTINNLIGLGNHGEMDQDQHYTFVTDSAVVMMTEATDTLFVHADTIRAYTDSTGKLSSINAFHKVKFFRHNGQGLCDSAYYNAADSLLKLYYKPVLWYETYQCTSDSMNVKHDTTGLSLAHLSGNSLVVQYVDIEKFNQLKGKTTTVYFNNGKPSYADIIGNAQMVYYITEEDSLKNQNLIGVNLGTGSSMRIYFAQSKAVRLVTYGNPDMQTYPLKQMPEDKKRLPNFEWYEDQRPKSPKEIF